MDVEKKSNAQQVASTATTGENVPEKMETETQTKKKDLMKLVVDDPWLEPHNDKIKWRYERFEALKNEIEKVEGSLDAFSSAYQDKFGFIKRPDGVVYREWAPGAAEVTLTGDFNGWNRDTHKMQKDEHGVWSVFVPNAPDGIAIPHGSKVKAVVGYRDQHGQYKREDRVPVWAKRVVEHFHDGQRIFDAVHWDPPQQYQWKNKAPSKPASLHIYETHVGMSSREPRVSSYAEFRQNLLPYIKETGYTAIQLMAVMEHSYYPSFGYQVTNFFAVSSRFGTPEELKELVDAAHGLGLQVYLDLVHSHASPNVGDGLNNWDGTEYHYFHSGGKGNHSGWGTRLFDYGKWEVLRFLMSNLKWFVDEYKFDGFRFDGVTSMLYVHHGNYTSNWDYDTYFGGDVDEDSVRYLQLANYMLHKNYPGIVTIAEDVSGMAGLCRPVEDGGVGFDYRLGMGLPDMWAKMCTEVKDEDWSMQGIVWDLTNRRWNEATVAYCESHDQSLQGGKTIAFRLMDKEMYWHMSTLQPLHMTIDRGIALHKMIRLITLGLGGEAYLAFMGNEWGHPEWVDFPRPGNNNSYDKCRRRWDLLEDKLLRYQHMYNLDKAMLHLANDHPFLNTREYVIVKHEDNKLITFERGEFYWIFNFHPTKSFPDYRVGVTHPGKYEIMLDTDAAEYGGHSRMQAGVSFFTEPKAWDDRPNSMLIYAPCRAALVLKRAQE